VSVNTRISLPTSSTLLPLPLASTWQPHERRPLAQIDCSQSREMCSLEPIDFAGAKTRWGSRFSMASDGLFDWDVALFVKFADDVLYI